MQGLQELCERVWKAYFCIQKPIILCAMNIYNVIILDESGSMSSIYHETLTSMNEVLGGIRKDQEEHPEQKNFVP